MNMSQFQSEKNIDNNEGRKRAIPNTEPEDDMVTHAGYPAKRAITGSPSTPCQDENPTWDVPYQEHSTPPTQIRSTAEMAAPTPQTMVGMTAKLREQVIPSVDPNVLGNYKKNNNKKVKRKNTKD